MANVGDLLSEALVERYQELKDLRDQWHEGTEEYEEYDKKLEQVIKEMQTYHKNDLDADIKYDEHRISEENNQAQLDLEREKLEEHARVERERNETTLLVEHGKQRLTWPRIAFEIAKLVVPALVSGGIYFKAQRRVLEFEENGRISSTAGRELHLPKLPK